MSKESVIVSSLFNIQREGMDGRTWEDYLEWFEITLKLKCPMILFVTEDLKSFIEERRGDLPTKIIVQGIDEMPYSYLKDQLDEIIESDEYKNRIKDPTRIECQHSMYAGGSRFFEDFDLEQEYPSINATEALNQMGDKFLVQMNMEYYKDHAEASILPKSYLLDNRSYILGSMFGGGINSLKKVAADVEDIFLNKMIGEGFVNNEQIALGYLVKQNPDDYEIYRRYNGKHMALFEELGKQ